MERKQILTGDGSHSIAVPALNVTYHSIHGAIQESRHVYIDAGLRAAEGFAILEMGFGTGLNALLTFIDAEKTKQEVHYTALELYPLSWEEAKTLNYCEQLDRADLQPVFEKMHLCEWEKEIRIAPGFTIHKMKADLVTLSANQFFNLIYYDAFAPAAQPELWTGQIFQKLFDWLLPGGILVTYCSKGDVRRNMMAAGFETERLKGPPGKREMLRGRKL